MNREGVLLLGGTGFIGSALAKRLQQEKMQRAHSWPPRRGISWNRCCRNAAR